MSGKGRGRRVYPAHVWTYIRTQVEHTSKSVTRIAQEMGVARSTVFSRINRERWTRPEKGQVTPVPEELNEPARRSGFVARLYAAYDLQMQTLETRLMTLEDGAEKTREQTGAGARMLASLAKTLDQIIKLERLEEGADGDERTGEQELRDALAQRLAHLCASGKGE
ncbi:hypothetical protein [Flexibacterium corallicola]|uniref:hypothetical protein n=1 Tax=Flexibacterium corallicola TaxID=3037259 RepID=UPI00286F4E85|nr:hypothetical protein [Pseudovibrio sp. M1P-2-3]